MKRLAKINPADASVKAVFAVRAKAVFTDEKGGALEKYELFPQSEVLFPSRFSQLYNSNQFEKRHFFQELPGIWSKRRC